MECLGDWKALVLGSGARGDVAFGKSWDGEKTLKTVCAFANDLDGHGGGVLVIGVKAGEGKEPKWKGVPEKKVDGVLKEIRAACKRIQPAYRPLLEIVRHEGKTFVVVRAPAGCMRPYSLARDLSKHGRDRVCFIRRDGATVEPDAQELHNLLSLANQIPFDDRANYEAELADLNIALIRSYLKETGSPLYGQAGEMDFMELCQRMNIVSAQAGDTKPKNVGLLFFSLAPERFFPCAQIDVVEFPDGPGGDTIIEHTFRGPLHQQLREALRYLRGNVLREIVVKQPDAAEARQFYNYPYAALEEALSNAVYHKGYEVREPIEVRVLPDRVEIVSHAGADRSLTGEDIQTGHVFHRRYRNRRVGEFLKALRLIEGRTTGLEKIRRALAQNGSPEPLFETDAARTFFAVTLYIHPEARGPVPSGIPEIVELPENISLNALTGSEHRVYMALREDPSLTKEKIAERIGRSKSTVSRALSALREKGYIVRDGANKNGRWLLLQ